METYHFDALNRYKCFSEKLDVVKVLTNKSWVAFDDTGERVLYIFQPDGSLIIATDGVGYKGTWQWIPVNNSLVIDDSDEITLLRPEYIDNVVVTLTLAGTDRYVFFIEENNSLSFAPKTLGQLNSYFLDKEKKLIEQKVKTLDGAEAEKKLRLEEERIKECEELWEKRDQNKHMRRAALIKSDQRVFSNIGWLALFALVLGLVSVLFILGKLVMIFIPVFTLIACIIIFLLYNDRKSYKEGIKHYKMKHPNDPANQYLN